MLFDKLIMVYFSLFALSVIFVFGLASQEKVVIVQESDLSNISCGWPFNFLVSDQSWRNPPLPWLANCFKSEWGDSFVIIWPSLIFDILFFYISLILLWVLLIKEKKQK